MAQNDDQKNQNPTQQKITTGPKVQELVICVRHGDKDEVERLLEEGVDINAKWRGNALTPTALHEVARFQRKKVKNSADTNAEKEDMVRYLIERGASVNIQDGIGATPLHYAVQNGSQSIVQYLIEHEAKIDTQDELGKTPLHYAAEDGNLGTIQSLIERGANIEVADKGGKTPLHYAIENGSQSIVQYLIEYEAKIDTPDKNGKTPLHYAATHAQKDIADYLVGQGANINAVDNNKRIPLHLAAERGDLDTVQYLVGQQSTSINALDKAGRTPLHYAATCMQKDIAEYLVGQGADINAVDNNKRIPLHLAAELGGPDTVQYLVGQEGAKINAVDKDGSAPLHLAVGDTHLSFFRRSKDVDVVKTLLQGGADVNLKNNIGQTPLSYTSNNPEIKKLLEDAKNNQPPQTAQSNSITLGSTGQTYTSPPPKNIDPNTPIQTSPNVDDLPPPPPPQQADSLSPIANKEATVLRAEVSSSSPNASEIQGTSVPGSTPPPSAATLTPETTPKGTTQEQQTLGNVQGEWQNVTRSSGKINLGKKSFEGEERGSVDSGSITLDDIPPESNDTTNIHQNQNVVANTSSKKVDEFGDAEDVSPTGSERTSSTNTPQNFALENHNSKPISIVPGSSGPQDLDIDTLDNLGNAPLHRAVLTGDAKDVKALIEQGANVNVKDTFGSTPLHRAAVLGNKDIVKYLINQGADIKATNNIGSTPLHEAVQSENKTLVEYLVKKGAEVNAKNELGATPLDVANRLKNKAIVKYLATKSPGMTVREKDDKMPEELAQNNQIKNVTSKSKQKSQALPRDVTQPSPQITAPQDTTKDATKQADKSTKSVNVFGNSGMNIANMFNITKSTRVDKPFEEKTIPQMRQEIIRDLKENNSQKDIEAIRLKTQLYYEKMRDENKIETKPLAFEFKNTESPEEWDRISRALGNYITATDKEGNNILHQMAEKGNMVGIENLLRGSMNAVDQAVLLEQKNNRGRNATTTVIGAHAENSPFFDLAAELLINSVDDYINEKEWKPIYDEHNLTYMPPSYSTYTSPTRYKKGLTKALEVLSRAGAIDTLQPGLPPEVFKNLVNHKMSDREFDEIKPSYVQSKDALVIQNDRVIDALNKGSSTVAKEAMADFEKSLDHSPGLRLALERNPTALSNLADIAINQPLDHPNLTKVLGRIAIESLDQRTNSGEQNITRALENNPALAKCMQFVDAVKAEYTERKGLEEKIDIAKNYIKQNSEKISQALKPKERQIDPTQDRSGKTPQELQIEGQRTQPNAQSSDGPAQTNTPEQTSQNTPQPTVDKRPPIFNVLGKRKSKGMNVTDLPNPINIRSTPKSFEQKSTFEMREDILSDIRTPGRDNEVTTSKIQTYYEELNKQNKVAERPLAHEFARTNDAEELRQAARGLGNEIHARDDKGNSLLHIMIQEGNLRGAENLLSSVTPINRARLLEGINVEGHTPADVAINSYKESTASKSRMKFINESKESTEQKKLIKTLGLLYDFGAIDTMRDYLPERVLKKLADHKMPDAEFAQIKPSAVDNKTKLVMANELVMRSLVEGNEVDEKALGDFVSSLRHSPGLRRRLEQNPVVLSNLVDQSTIHPDLPEVLGTIALESLDQRTMPNQQSINRALENNEGLARCMDFAYNTQAQENYINDNNRKELEQKLHLVQTYFNPDIGDISKAIQEPKPELTQQASVEIDKEIRQPVTELNQIDKPTDPKHSPQEHTQAVQQFLQTGKEFIHAIGQAPQEIKWRDIGPGKQEFRFTVDGQKEDRITASLVKYKDGGVCRRLEIPDTMEYKGEVSMSFAVRYDGNEMVPDAPDVPRLNVKFEGGKKVGCEITGRFEQIFDKGKDDEPLYAIRDGKKVYFGMTCGDYRALQAEISQNRSQGLAGDKIEKSQPALALDGVNIGPNRQKQQEIYRPQPSPTKPQRTLEDIEGTALSAAAKMFDKAEKAVAQKEGQDAALNAAAKMFDTAEKEIASKPQTIQSPEDIAKLLKEAEQSLGSMERDITNLKKKRQSVLDIFDDKLNQEASPQQRKEDEKAYTPVKEDELKMIKADTQYDIFKTRLAGLEDRINNPQNYGTENAKDLKESFQNFQNDIGEIKKEFQVLSQDYDATIQNETPRAKEQPKIETEDPKVETPPQSGPSEQAIVPTQSTKKFIEQGSLGQVSGLEMEVIKAILEGKEIDRLRSSWIKKAAKDIEGPQEERRAGAVEKVDSAIRKFESIAPTLIAKDREDASKQDISQSAGEEQRRVLEERALRGIIDGRRTSDESRMQDLAAKMKLEEIAAKQPQPPTIQIPPQPLLAIEDDPARRTKAEDITPPPPSRRQAEEGATVDSSLSPDIKPSQEIDLNKSNDPARRTNAEDIKPPPPSGRQAEEGATVDSSLSPDIKPSQEIDLNKSNDPARRTNAEDIKPPPPSGRQAEEGATVDSSLSPDIKPSQEIDLNKSNDPARRTKAEDIKPPPPSGRQAEEGGIVDSSLSPDIKPSQEIDQDKAVDLSNSEQAKSVTTQQSVQNTSADKKENQAAKIAEDNAIERTSKEGAAAMAAAAGLATNVVATAISSATQNVSKKIAKEKVANFAAPPSQAQTIPQEPQAVAVSNNQQIEEDKKAKENYIATLENRRDEAREYLKDISPAVENLQKGLEDLTEKTTQLKSNHPIQRDLPKHQEKFNEVQNFRQEVANGLAVLEEEIKRVNQSDATVPDEQERRQFGAPVRSSEEDLKLINTLSDSIQKSNEAGQKTLDKKELERLRKTAARLAKIQQGLKQQQDQLKRSIEKRNAATTIQSAYRGMKGREVAREEKGKADYLVAIQTRKNESQTYLDTINPAIEQTSKALEKLKEDASKLKKLEEVEGFKDKAKDSQDKYQEHSNNFRNIQGDRNEIQDRLNQLDEEMVRMEKPGEVIPKTEERPKYTNPIRDVGTAIEVINKFSDSIKQTNLEVNNTLREYNQVQKAQKQEAARIAEMDRGQYIKALESRISEGKSYLNSLGEVGESLEELKNTVKPLREDHPAKQDYAKISNEFENRNTEVEDRLQELRNELKRVQNKLSPMPSQDERKALESPLKINEDDINKLKDSIASSKKMGLDAQLETVQAITPPPQPEKAITTPLPPMARILEEIQQDQRESVALASQAPVVQQKDEEILKTLEEARRAVQNIGQAIQDINSRFTGMMDTLDARDKQEKVDRPGDGVIRIDIKEAQNKVTKVTKRYDELNKRLENLAQGLDSEVYGDKYGKPTEEKLKSIIKEAKETNQSIQTVRDEHAITLNNEIFKQSPSAEQKADAPEQIVKQETEAQKPKPELSSQTPLEESPLQNEATSQNIGKSSFLQQRENLTLSNNVEAFGENSLKGVTVARSGSTSLKVEQTSVSSSADVGTTSNTTQAMAEIQTPEIRTTAPDLRRGDDTTQKTDSLVPTNTDMSNALTINVGSSTPSQTPEIAPPAPTKATVSIGGLNVIDSSKYVKPEVTTPLTETAEPITPKQSEADKLIEKIEGDLRKMRDATSSAGAKKTGLMENFVEARKLGAPNLPTEESLQKLGKDTLDRLEKDYKEFEERLAKFREDKENQQESLNKLSNEVAAKNGQEIGLLNSVTTNIDKQNAELEKAIQVERPKLATTEQYAQAQKSIDDIQQEVSRLRTKIQDISQKDLEELAINSTLMPKELKNRLQGTSLTGDNIGEILNKEVNKLEEKIEKTRETLNSPDSKRYIKTNDILSIPGSLRNDLKGINNNLTDINQSIQKLPKLKVKTTAPEVVKESDVPPSAPLVARAAEPDTNSLPLHPLPTNTKEQSAPNPVEQNISLTPLPPLEIKRSEPPKPEPMKEELTTLFNQANELLKKQDDANKQFSNKVNEIELKIEALEGADPDKASKAYSQLNEIQKREGLVSFKELEKIEKDVNLKDEERKKALGGFVRSVEESIKTTTSKNQELEEFSKNMETTSLTKTLEQNLDINTQTQPIQNQTPVSSPEPVTRTADLPQSQREEVATEQFRSVLQQITERPTKEDQSKLNTVYRKGYSGAKNRVRLAPISNAPTIPPQVVQVPPPHPVPVPPPHPVPVPPPHPVPVPPPHPVPVPQSVEESRPRQASTMPPKPPISTQAPTAVRDSSPLPQAVPTGPSQPAVISPAPPTVSDTPSQTTKTGSDNVNRGEKLVETSTPSTPVQPTTLESPSVPQPTTTDLRKVSEIRVQSNDISVNKQTEPTTNPVTVTYGNSAAGKQEKQRPVYGSGVGQSFPLDETNNKALSTEAQPSTTQHSEGRGQLSKADLQPLPSIQSNSNRSADPWVKKSLDQLAKEASDKAAAAPEHAKVANSASTTDLHLPARNETQSVNERLSEMTGNLAGGPKPKDPNLSDGKNTSSALEKDGDKEPIQSAVTVWGEVPKNQQNTTPRPEDLSGLAKVADEAAKLSGLKQERKTLEGKLEEATVNKVKNTTLWSKIPLTQAWAESDNSNKVYDQAHKELNEVDNQIKTLTVPRSDKMQQQGLEGPEAVFSLPQGLMNPEGNPYQKSSPGANQGVTDTWADAVNHINGFTPIREILEQDSTNKGAIQEAQDLFENYDHDIEGNAVAFSCYTNLRHGGRAGSNIAKQLNVSKNIAIREELSKTLGAEMKRSLERQQSLGSPTVHSNTTPRGNQPNNKHHKGGAFIG
ncbi:hypothetical protein phytr_130 [Candidatus Phycorickettsia trachydisci]|uniref:Uncharacterized protein n=1 Tax=Candidatus Phycorickettsia trachydisci TaxID=2115978 RepID=A0A2P1P6U6_9RICK|nr:ankyrin repeat domain-containing protein [Candidatus Phycorickettsia trachydisci]AVP86977.1 hypothetical protein phytr_130 [Candidatus Phycorickettsia trachydisci]